MDASPLSLERLEFTKISLVANPAFRPPKKQAGPQLDFNFHGVNFARRSKLRFSPEEVNDPRHFYCAFGLSLSTDDQSKVSIPYEIEMEVSALVTYLGDQLKDAERFRAIRFTTYQMLYGAIREMVATISARSQWGLWQLPTADFRRAAKEESQQDEQKRQEQLAALGAPVEAPSSDEDLTAVGKGKRKTKQGKS